MDEVGLRCSVFNAILKRNFNLPSPYSSVGSAQDLKLGDASLIPALVNFFLRNDDSNCHIIHSSLTADNRHNIYVNENNAETVLNTIQSYNQLKEIFSAMSGRVKNPLAVYSATRRKRSVVHGVLCVNGHVTSRANKDNYTIWRTASLAINELIIWSIKRMTLSNNKNEDYQLGAVMTDILCIMIQLFQLFEASQIIGREKTSLPIVLQSLAFRMRN